MSYTYHNIVRRRPEPAPGSGGPVLRCAVTGYRPQKMPFPFDGRDPLYLDFARRLRTAIELLIHQGYSHFLTGGALGVDLCASSMVLDLKKDYPWIGLEIAVPFDRQDELWPESERLRYRDILGAADIVTCTGRAYTPFCMAARNYYLVNNADLLLAVWDGLRGGTAMTVNYARQLRVPVMTLLPVNTFVSQSFNQNADCPGTVRAV